jgi:hypothetical protein
VADLLLFPVYFGRLNSIVGAQRIAAALELQLMKLMGFLVW